VNIEMISTSEVRITCTIAEDQLEAAATALHAAFALASPDPLEAPAVTPNLPGATPGLLGGTPDPAAATPEPATATPDPAD
jgi:hypothetical protein